MTLLAIYFETMMSCKSQQRRDREPDVADEIRTREHTLEQLKRDLDRLLRRPKVA
jgi:hypothetical protein